MINNSVKITIIAVLFTILSLTQGVDAICSIAWMAMFDIAFILFVCVLTFILSWIEYRNIKRALAATKTIAKFL
jgi:hypothetical protein